MGQQSRGEKAEGQLPLLCKVPFKSPAVQNNPPLATLARNPQWTGPFFPNLLCRCHLLYRIGRGSASLPGLPRIRCRLLARQPDPPMDRPFSRRGCELGPHGSIDRVYRPTEPPGAGRPALINPPAGLNKPAIRNPPHQAHSLPNTVPARTKSACSMFRRFDCSMLRLCNSAIGCAPLGEPP